MEDLVKNGDFSQVQDGKSVGWSTSGDAECVDLELTIAEEDGRPCARLECSRSEGPVQSRFVTLEQAGHVRLEQGRYYELICRVRAEGIREQTAGVTIVETESSESCGLDHCFWVTESWTEQRIPFRATRSAGETGRLQFRFRELGALYLADVRIGDFDPAQITVTNTVPRGPGKNLVPNGSFELGKIGWSAVGEPISWANLDRLPGSIEDSGGTHGARFLRVPMGRDEALVFHWGYYEPMKMRLRTVLAANLGWIPVEPGKPHTLSCDMRANVYGVTATLGVRTQDLLSTSGRGAEDLRRRVTLSTEWQRYSFTFRPENPFLYVTVGPDLTREVNVHVDVDAAVDIDAVQLEESEQATAFEPYNTVEAGLEPSASAGVFVEGEEAWLTLRVHNSGEAPAKVNVGFEVTDFFDEPAELPPASLEAPPGTTAESRVDLPADWKGYYRLRGQCDGAYLVGEEWLRMAAVPRPTVEDGVLGVNHAFADPYMTHQAKKAGITWYRDWSLKWQDLEPAPGEYHWEIGDVQIDRIVAEGVHLMNLLPPYPATRWNTTASPEAAREGRVPRDLAWAPEDPSQLAEFLQKAVAHYRDRVQVWEFLNEPIYTHYALPQRTGGYEPADYVELLKLAYAAMHRADPDCIVIGGIGSLPRKLTEEVIDAGCMDHVDVFVLHMYPSRGELTPEHFIPQTELMLEHMDEHGGRKPIWITEMSYYGEDLALVRPSVQGQGSWQGSRALPGERECAEYTIRLFAVMMARGSEKFFFHAGVGGQINTSRGGCCFFNYGGTPAKLFPALAVYSEMMGERREFVGEKRLGEDGYCVGFETDRRAVLILWRAVGEAAVSVPEGAECGDIVGRPVVARPVPISSAVVYLTGSPGTAEQMMDAVELVQD